jgi:hypothetical protein
VATSLLKDCSSCPGKLLPLYNMHHRPPRLPSFFFDQSTLYRTTQAGLGHDNKPLYLLFYLIIGSTSMCIVVAEEAISRSLSIEYFCCHHKWQVPPITTTIASFLQHSYTCSYPYGGAIIQLSKSNMTQDANEQDINHSCCNNIVSIALKLCCQATFFSISL